MVAIACADDFRSSWFPEFAWTGKGRIVFVVERHRVFDPSPRSIIPLNQVLAIVVLPAVGDGDIGPQSLARWIVYTIVDAHIWVDVLWAKYILLCQRKESIFCIWRLERSQLAGFALQGFFGSGRVLDTGKSQGIPGI